jgi:hypothetical protein
MFRGGRALEASVLFPRTVSDRWLKRRALDERGQKRREVRLSLARSFVELQDF